MKTSIKIILLISLAFYFSNSYAQTIKTSGNQLASVDYKRLANIDTFINGYVKEIG